MGVMLEAHLALGTACKIMSQKRNTEGHEIHHENHGGPFTTPLGGTRELLTNYTTYTLTAHRFTDPTVGFGFRHHLRFRVELISQDLPSK